MNRYAFAGGNPISFVELDGHRYIVSDGVYAHSITGKIVEDRSSSTASGSGGDSSGYGLRDFGKDVGGFFVGLWEGFSETVTGIYQSGCLSAASPVLAMVGPGINACAETVSNTVSYAVNDPKGFGLALWHGTTDPIVDDWNRGNYGEAIGRGVFAIAELALGTKGATKLGSLAKSNLRGMGNILRSERGSISFGGSGGEGKVLGRGSTANPSKGSTLPRNLREQLAIEQAMSNPTAGKVLAVPMTDPRWPASEGWVKMQQMIYPSGAPINVHYVYNKITGEMDDFKIKFK